MRIAVLALQGAFREHEEMLFRLDVSSFEVRQTGDLSAPFDGLILPGGESTVQGKLLRETGLFDPLRERIAAGLPVFGTCAGLILLAEEIENEATRHLALMKIRAVRNAYGRQLGSFFTEGAFDGGAPVPMTFIRAPYIAAAGEGVRVLSVTDGRITAARQRNMLVTAFHPELNDDLTVHRYFLEMVKEAKTAAARKSAAV